MNEMEIDSGMPSRDARQWAMFCHLGGLVGMLFTGLGGLVLALVLWLLKKEEDSFIDDQGKEAVNFQLTILLAGLVSGVLALILIGFLLLIIVGLVGIIFPIIAAIKANDGEHYRYPINIRFIS